MIKELLNNKSKYFYKKYKTACIKYLTNEYDNSKYIESIVIKASSFLKVSNSLRNSISIVFCLDYNMPYGREEVTSSFPSNVHETLTVLKAKLSSSNFLPLRKENNVCALLSQCSSRSGAFIDIRISSRTIHRLPNHCNKPLRITRWFQF